MYDSSGAILALCGITQNSGNSLCFGLCRDSRGLCRDSKAPGYLCRGPKAFEFLVFASNRGPEGDPKNDPENIAKFLSRNRHKDVPKGIQKWATRITRHLKLGTGFQKSWASFLPNLRACPVPGFNEPKIVGNFECQAYCENIMHSHGI